MRGEAFTDPITFHGEGPVWWPDDDSSVSNSLRLVDMLAGAVVTVRDGVVARADTGSAIAAFLRPRRSGGAVVATAQGLSLARSPDLVDLEPWVRLVDDDDVRFNDGGCDPSGAVYAGTMRYDTATGGGTLYRVTPDGSWTVALDDATISNGLAWTVDGLTAYYNDTPTRTTWAFDWDPERGLCDRRALFTLDQDDPANGPDGLCVDDDGNVWVAIHGGSRVECRAADGRLLERVEVPVTQPTSCAFGGEGLADLFVTTSRENLPPDAQPEAGAVFVVRSPGPRGAPVAPFAG